MILAGPISAHRHRGANLSLSRGFPLASPYNVIPANSHPPVFFRSLLKLWIQPVDPTHFWQQTLSVEGVQNQKHYVDDAAS
jgi:hypothetical protein